MEILVAVLASVIAGSGGCLVYFFKRHFRKVEKFAELAETKRVKKDLLVLKSLKALGELSLANCVALKKGVCNGSLDKAQKEFEVVEKELNVFLLELAASLVTKKK